MAFHYNPGHRCLQRVHGSFGFHCSLPYLEEENTYNTFNLIRPFNSFCNLTEGLIKTATYICPSDSQAPTIPTFSSSSRQLRNSYAMRLAAGRKTSLSTGRCSAYFRPHTAVRLDLQLRWWRRRVFDPKHPCGSAAITDGTSNTFLLGEMSRFKNEPAGSKFNFGNVHMGLCRATLDRGQPHLERRYSRHVGRS